MRAEVKELLGSYLICLNHSLKYSSLLCCMCSGNPKWFFKRFKNTKFISCHTATFVSCNDSKIILKGLLKRILLCVVVVSTVYSREPKTGIQIAASKQNTPFFQTKCHYGTRHGCKIGLMQGSRFVTLSPLPVCISGLVYTPHTLIYETS